MNKPHQRIGAKSNTHVGKDFEIAAQKFFVKNGLNLERNIKIPLGVSSYQKEHAFDLGCEDKEVIVECKSHRWTSPNYNMPSAKLTVWNEAMYYFHLSPNHYRKIMFVLRDFNPKRRETLAEYYLRTRKNLIPEGVEFWEYDDTQQTAKRLL
ncbi:hypothetical protein JQC92_00910 [Shewanella sp. 202IG2-18]|uniref:hypothetical protein n=1 Tax=Parashewanella hymeniacidonis TaxID=2807618 RepID=UPI0019604BC2|nr:hypothetical protein [Parashewanella hymeniacidonis]MBM7070604.1 hypothetical protein [Parashewanella hymeniacidonis]